MSVMRMKVKHPSHGHPQDIDDFLVIQLRDLGHTMHSLYEGKGSQKRILIILLEAGNISQRELTAWLGIKPGSASEVLGKMEASGLIERNISAADKRTFEICLTKKGEQLAKEAERNRKFRHKEMFSCLSEEEKQTLSALAEKVRRDWEKRYKRNTERV